MRSKLVTVVEVKAFSAEARGRIKPEEIAALVGVLADKPETGDVIRGTGGLRKIRFAVAGRG